MFKRQHFVASLFLLSLLACQLPAVLPSAGRATPTGLPPTVAATQPAAPKATPAPTALPAPAASPTAVPQPLGYVDALQAKVASGEWTLEQGLTTTLKLLNGEATSQDAFGTTPLQADEVTGLLDQAALYLKTGSDASAKTEIQRLLNHIAPTPDIFNKIATPAPASVAPSLNLIRFTPQTRQCQGTNDPSDTYPCLQVTSYNLSGSHIAVYLSANLPADDPLRAKLPPLRQAIQDTLNAFHPYGDLPNINVYFSPLTGQGLLATAAAWTNGSTPGACLVLLFPTGLAFSEGNFKQLIAHELFHCFQGNYYSGQMSVDYLARRWWTEGTAEYFSNVVYPANNNEYIDLAHYDQQITEFPITNSDGDIAYGNSNFFQFLANAGGNNSVISFIGHMPTTGGEDAQQAALAGITNIGPLFHEFGQQLTDRTLVDSDGVKELANRLPAQAPLAGQITIAGAGPQTPLTASPFRVMRYSVTVAETQGFTLSLATSGDEGRSSAEPITSAQAWGPLPTDFACGIAPRQYIVLLTSAVPDVAAEHTLSLTAAVTNPDCQAAPVLDPCLVGTWAVDPTSYIAYLNSSFQANGAQGAPTVSGITGSLTVTYNADGTSHGGYDNFLIKERVPDQTNVNNNAVDVVIEVIITGGSQGTYNTSNGTLHYIQTGQPQFNITSKVFVGGVEMPGGQFPMDPSVFQNAIGSTTTTYTCTRDTLTVTLMTTGNPVLVYHHS